MTIVEDYIKKPPRGRCYEIMNDRIENYKKLNERWFYGWGDTVPPYSFYIEELIIYESTH